MCIYLLTHLKFADKKGIFLNILQDESDEDAKKKKPKTKKAAGTPREKKPR